MVCMQRQEQGSRRACLLPTLSRAPGIYHLTSLCVRPSFTPAPPLLSTPTRSPQQLRRLLAAPAVTIAAAPLTGKTAGGIKRAAVLPDVWSTVVREAASGQLPFHGLSPTLPPPAIPSPPFDSPLPDHFLPAHPSQPQHHRPSLPPGCHFVA